MDSVIVERLKALWNELAYLKTEREQVARFPDYAASPRARRAVERSLQISIEACLISDGASSHWKNWKSPTTIPLFSESCTLRASYQTR